MFSPKSPCYELINRYCSRCSWRTSRSRSNDWIYTPFLKKIKTKIGFRWTDVGWHIAGVRMLDILFWVRQLCTGWKEAALLPPALHYWKQIYYTWQVKLANGEVLLSVWMDGTYICQCKLVSVRSLFHC